jgi:hypothetical protein
VGSESKVREAERKNNAEIFFFMFFTLSRFTRRSTFSLDYPVRPRQQIGRDGQTELLGGFKIYDEFKLR